MNSVLVSSNLMFVLVIDSISIANFEKTFMIIDLVGVSVPVFKEMNQQRKQKTKMKPIDTCKSDPTL